LKFVSPPAPLRGRKKRRAVMSNKPPSPLKGEKEKTSYKLRFKFQVSSFRFQVSGFEFEV
jgi:hypothetical protein